MRHEVKACWCSYKYTVITANPDYVNGDGHLKIEVQSQESNGDAKISAVA